VLEFRVLGPLEVRREGQSIELPGSKRRAALALLVLHANEVVRTHRLIEDLWGDKLPANASAALHNHVSRLRKELGSEVIATKPWGYVLRTDPEAIDLEHFERLVAEAKPLAARERRAKLTEALALWRGPALADLGHEPALALEIERLEELRLSALEQRIDADLELGGHEGLVSELEALVAEHPLRERLRGQLILALYRAGRQAEALETYRETRRVLVEELGIEPSPELRELERAILRQDPALASASATPEPSDPQRPKSGWRWPRSPLVLAGLLLLAGGAAAATMFAFDDESPAPAAAWPPQQSTVDATPAHPVTKPVVAKTKKPAAHPSARAKPAPRVAHPRRSTPAVEQPARPHRRHSDRRQARSTATGLEQAKPVSRPRPTHAKKATKPIRVRPKSPPPLADPYWLADGFDDPAFDFGMWHLASHGSGVEVAEKNGQLEFSIAADVVTEGPYGVDQHYGTKCLLTGSFDAQVSFRLLSWPEASGVYLTLGVYHPPPHEAFWSISRQGRPARGGSEAYSSLVGRDSGLVQTADQAGALRVRRDKGVLTTYYRYRDRWVALATAFEPGRALLTLALSTNADEFGHQAASAAFDDFQATATAVDCPGVPIPPRKPR
jgi:DNA-binding SARP family transcriptional activator